jgi:predicted transcriptional regulator
MGKAVESVTLDDDVGDDLRRLAERSGRPLDAVANAALRDYLRYENEVTASVERGIADLDGGRARTTPEILEHLRAQRRARQK